MKKSLLLLLLFTGCHRAHDTIEPQVDYTVQDRYLQMLPEPFTPLSPIEREQPWGQEYLVGQGFAKELDLYRAITAYKRAEFLLPEGYKGRLLEIEYHVIHAYYLGKRYQEVIATFSHSKLRHADESFPAYHDLLVILYESYRKVGEDEHAARMLDYIKQVDPETGHQLTISTALIEADFPTLRHVVTQDPSEKNIAAILETYERKKKDPGTASALNAILPGAGYLYVGQKQSALTSFLLNGLFIGATYLFLHNNNYPAGIITLSFEAGWYLGGIYGAGEQAKLYNERIYETMAHHHLASERLFPVLTLRYNF